MTVKEKRKRGEKKRRRMTYPQHHIPHIIKGHAILCHLDFCADARKQTHTCTASTGSLLITLAWLMFMVIKELYAGRGHAVEEQSFVHILFASHSESKRMNSGTSGEESLAFGLTSGASAADSASSCRPSEGQRPVNPANPTIPIPAPLKVKSRAERTLVFNE